MPVKLDFALILTVLSAFTGVVWLVDRAVLRQGAAR